MNRVTTRLVLDLKKHGIQGSVTAVSGDALSREVEISLVSGEESFPSDGVRSAVVRASKPDGTVIFSPCIQKDGVFSFVPGANMLASEGLVICRLSLYGFSGEELGTPSFSIEVEKCVPSDGEIASTNEFSAVDRLLADTNTLFGEAKSAADASAASAAEAKSAEAIAAASAARYPYIAEDGIWYVWDGEQNSYRSTGVKAKAEDAGDFPVAAFVGEADFFSLWSEEKASRRADFPTLLSALEGSLDSRYDAHFSRLPSGERDDISAVGEISFDVGEARKRISLRELKRYISSPEKSVSAVGFLPIAASAGYRLEDMTLGGEIGRVHDGGCAVDIGIYGKNLISASSAPSSAYGVSFTSDADGSFNISGLPTVNANVVIFQSKKLVCPGTYFLSGCPSDAPTGTQLKLCVVDRDGTVPAVFTDTGSGVKCVLSEELCENAAEIQIKVRVSASSAYNIVMRPQLEVGDAPGAFSPYREPKNISLEVTSPLLSGDVLSYSESCVHRASGDDVPCAFPDIILPEGDCTLLATDGVRFAAISARYAALA